MKQVKRFTSNKNLTFILGILLLALVWQILSVWIGERTMVFPGPFESFCYAFYLLGREYTWKCIAATMYRMLKGFGISLLFGIFFGVLAGNSRLAEELLQPAVIALRAVPTASLVYLFIVLAGFKNAPVYLVILISFPIIYEGVLGGIRNIPASIVNAMKVDGASFWRSNLKIRLPLALPYIIVAMTTSFSLCFKIEIMAEVITGASDVGLGSAILGMRASDPTNMVPIFGYSLIAVALMLLIDQLGSLIKDQIRIN